MCVCGHEQIWHRKGFCYRYQADEPDRFCRCPAYVEDESPETLF